MHSGASTEVLVIGCGIGGGVAALTLADAGVPVTVVTRAETATESNTWYAQGGIIFRGVGDSSRLLAEDILRAGAGHCHLPAVTIAAEEGPDLVQRILVDRVGVPFDRDESGALSLAREGSHALPRVAHAADATGQTISAALVKVLQDHPNVSMLTAHTAVDLLTPSPRSSCARRILSVLGATEWPWPTVPARASSTWSSCSSTPRRSSTTAPRASSSPRRSAVPEHGSSWPTASRSWTATHRSGRTSRPATSWPARSTTRC
jgi:succinate dehydrogenase/fumarate reductase flavoprotein subunit